MHALALLCIKQQTKFKVPKYPSSPFLHIWLRKSF